MKGEYIKMKMMINDEMMKMHGECAEAKEEWMNESCT